MPTHAELADAVRRLQVLADSFAGSLDQPLATMQQQVWVGPAADAFAAELTARRARVRTALHLALADAQRLLAATPNVPAQPAPGGR
jgi:hypothetical protein